MSAPQGKGFSPGKSSSPTSLRKLEKANTVIWRAVLDDSQPPLRGPNMLYRANKQTGNSLKRLITRAPTVQKPAAPGCPGPSPILPGSPFSTTCLLEWGTPKPSHMCSPATQGNKRIHKWTDLLPQGGENKGKGGGKSSL